MPDNRGPSEKLVVEILERQRSYDGYLKIESYRLRHSRFAGGLTEPLDRQVMDRGAVVALLPYDPPAGSGGFDRTVPHRRASRRARRLADRDRCRRHRARRDARGGRTSRDPGGNRTGGPGHRESGPAFSQPWLLQRGAHALLRPSRQPRRRRAVRPGTMRAKTFAPSPCPLPMPMKS